MELIVWTGSVAMSRPGLVQREGALGEADSQLDSETGSAAGIAEAGSKAYAPARPRRCPGLFDEQNTTL